MTFCGMKVYAQTAVAFLLLNNSVIEDKVYAFAFARLKGNHLGLVEVDCELRLLTEALQGSQLHL